MAARSPALAKLTRPQLYDALPRRRLFAALDAAAARPIVWLCGPPGAGKSTLVASWLEDREARHVWYQADSGEPYILVMQAVTLACLWSAEHDGALRHATAFVPFALLGALAGFALFERLTDNQFGKAIGAPLVVSGSALLVRLV